MPSATTNDPPDAAQMKRIAVPAASRAQIIANIPSSAQEGFHSVVFGASRADWQRHPLGCALVEGAASDPRVVLRDAKRSSGGNCHGCSPSRLLPRQQPVDRHGSRSPGLAWCALDRGLAQRRFRVERAPPQQRRETTATSPSTTWNGCIAISTTTVWSRRSRMTGSLGCNPVNGRGQTMGPNGSMASTLGISFERWTPGLQPANGPVGFRSALMIGPR